MAFAGKSNWDTYGYPDLYVFPTIKNIQYTGKNILDTIPMGDIPLGSERDPYYDDSFSYNGSTLAADYTASSDTTLTVAAGTGSRFAVGDIIQMGVTNVLYQITIVSTDTLTIGSAAVYGTKGDQSSGASVYIVSRGNLRGADAPTRKTRDPLARTCNTVLFNEQVSLDGDTAATDTLYGVTAAQRMAYEKDKTLKEALRRLAEMCIMSYAPASESATVRGNVDGLLPTLLTNNAISGGTGSLATYSQAFVTAMTLGAENIDLTYASPDQYGLLTSAFASQMQTSTKFAVGGAALPAIQTIFGEVAIVPCPFIRSVKTMLLIDSSKVSLHNMRARAFQFSPLGKVGDYDGELLTGRYGLKIFGRTESHAFVSFS